MVGPTGVIPQIPHSLLLDMPVSVIAQADMIHTLPQNSLAGTVVELCQAAPSHGLLCAPVDDS